MRCVCALTCAEDTISWFEFRFGCGGGRACEYRSCEFEACGPGERGLVLVFALDLEDVEEVCTRGVDFDGVCCWGWGWWWDGGYGEVEGSLEELS